MLPLKDTIRSRSFPVVNLLLIGANLLVFLYELSLTPSGLDRLIANYGLIPARIHWNQFGTLYPLVTNMFLHAGWLHILGNMWFLFIFGDNVEDRMGPMRYLLFYFLGGIAASTMQVVVDPSSQIPAIGASGAIAAVLGAYFVYFPRARVITLVFIFILPWIIEIPALIYLGIWFALQFFPGVLSLATSAGTAAGGVAWWAHIGGFLFGLILAMPFALRRRPSRWYPDEYRPW